MANPKATATYILAASLFAMAGALVYFSIVLTRVLLALPELTAEIQVTAEHIDPIVDEVHAIQEQIPLILEEVARVREQIPPILDQIPPILGEVEQIRLAIPPVLQETEQIRLAIPPILEEGAAYRETIPTILARIDAIEAQVPPILEEVEAVRSTIPLIMEQVEAIREEIPLHLDQAERISMNIETAGQQAGEGAVTGFFTGIIKAPKNIVTSLGESILSSPQLTDEDDAIIAETVRNLIQAGDVGREVSWRNPNTGMSGSVTLLGQAEDTDVPCMIVNISAYKRNKKLGESNIQVCLAEDGTWRFDEVK